MDSTNNQVWHSGDWKQQNNPRVPYNGIQIKATSNYSSQTSPPSSPRLVSVDVEVVDYTLDPNGVSSTINLAKTGTWYGIPIPENNTVSPPLPNDDFTITSTDGAHQDGQLQLSMNSSGVYLNIQFRYGEINNSREELGYIMKFDETI